MSTEQINEINRAVIHKHVDKLPESGLTEARKYFVDNSDYAKGEIIICNDPENPSIYILNNKGIVTKISGGSSNTNPDSPGYDGTVIQRLENLETSAGTIVYMIENNSDRINELIGEDENGNIINTDYNTLLKIANWITANTKTIEVINGNINSLSSHTETLNGIISGYSKQYTVNTHITDIEEKFDGLINKLESGIKETKNEISSTKTEIDSYTINSKPISESPILNSDDLQISENYLSNESDVINNLRYMTNVYTSDQLTNAISKLEIALAKTTLSLTSAIIDLESRIGTKFMSYDYKYYEWDDEKKNYERTEKPNDLSDDNSIIVTELPEEKYDNEAIKYLIIQVGKIVSLSEKYEELESKLNELNNRIPN